MKNQKQTIRKIIGFLNNPDEEGGFWLPNIQRPFVWDEEQISRLFDSILREYPISTLLIWKTNSRIRRRKFIDNWKNTLRLTDFYVPSDDKKKCLVLDGQQRLQSLFIALMGSFEGRELFFDILSGEVAAPDDVKYRFKFLDPTVAVFPWVKFKELIFTSQKKREISDRLKASSARALTGLEADKINDHLELVDRTFKIEEAVTYQELDSIDNPTLYTEDDVVEVFIRANSGGTKLGKSDLLFSLLSSSWDEADDRMNELLDALNGHGFAFTRDFILKTCLTLLDQGARYEIDKFRKPGVREKIETQWDAIADAAKDVLDFVREKTFIKCDKALPSYLLLIPLIYVRYHFSAAWKQVRDVETYLVRSAITGAFSGTPDQLIDSLVNKLKNLQRFDLAEVFSVIRTQGRSLDLTEDRLWKMGYGSDQIHLLFNLWYSFNYTPAYDGNLPQVDHIFPQSALRTVKMTNPDTGLTNLMRYKEGTRNQLANCMLLSQQENGSGGKTNILPTEWFKDKPVEYLEKHIIPQDKTLWELNRYEDFIAARKQLILEKFTHLLASTSTIAAAPPQDRAISAFSGDEISTLKPRSESGTTRQRGNLRIEIDWGKIEGKERNEIISEAESTKTLVKFVGRLWDHCGDAILSNLLKVKTGTRGCPFVSASPKKDFLNPKTLTPYFSNQIPGRSFYLLTHSGDKEKCKQVNELMGILRLPSVSVRAELLD